MTASATFSAPPPRDGVDTWPFDRATDLFMALSPASDRWGDEPSEWVFRGQANAEWSLRAKAARGASAFADLGIDGNPDNIFERRDMVVRVLTEFRRGLDRSGIAVPVEGPEVEPRATVSTNIEPEPHAFALMALAQHHGLPTLLLDWSHLAYVGAYFAAASALDPATGCTHLAVWALRFVDDPRRHWGEWTDLRLYHAPGATNPNLCAQHGLFTLLASEEVSSVEDYVAHAPKNPRRPLELRRLTLPVEEAGRLLRLLGLQGVDGASMFPGSDGVVRAMKERMHWRK